jgi:hypothetical protein
MNTGGATATSFENTTSAGTRFRRSRNAIAPTAIAGTINDSSIVATRGFILQPWPSTQPDSVRQPAWTQPLSLLYRRRLLYRHRLIRFQSRFVLTHIPQLTPHSAPDTLFKFGDAAAFRLHGRLILWRPHFRPIQCQRARCSTSVCAPATQSKHHAQSTAPVQRLSSLRNEGFHHVCSHSHRR